MGNKTYPPATHRPAQRRQKYRSLNRKSLVLLVPEAGLEPAQGCPRRILSPLRLPIPPLRQRQHFSLPECSLARGAQKKPGSGGGNGAKEKRQQGRLPPPLPAFDDGLPGTAPGAPPRVRSRGGYCVGRYTGISRGTEGVRGAGRPGPLGAPGPIFTLRASRIMDCRYRT
jgi:hypothetical protein